MTRILRTAVDGTLQFRVMAYCLAASLLVLGQFPVRAQDAPAPFSQAEISQMRDMVAQHGIDTTLNRSVTDALGITPRGNAPLTARVVSPVARTGFSYRFGPLRDGRYLLARITPGHTIYDDFLVSEHFEIIRTARFIGGSHVAIPRDEAASEFREIVAFFRSAIAWNTAHPPTGTQEHPQPFR